jgi:hypothetical protein
MAGNTIIDKNRLLATRLRDRKDNPWLPFYLPSERYEVGFADVKLDRYGVMPQSHARGAAIFSHANGDAGAEHRRTIAEWCEQNVAGKWSFGMDAVFFTEHDDAMLCKVMFS